LPPSQIEVFRLEVFELADNLAGRKIVQGGGALQKKSPAEFGLQAAQINPGVDDHAQNLHQAR
jgi:hypothetical protein